MQAKLLKRETLPTGLPPVFDSRIFLRGTLITLLAFLTYSNSTHANMQEGASSDSSPEDARQSASEVVEETSSDEEAKRAKRDQTNHASDGDQEQEDAGDAEVIESLPIELPPLPDDMFSSMAPKSESSDQFDPIFLIASGRMRLEVDESRDFAPEEDLQVGIAYTARLGADIPIGPHRAKMVLGEGQRIGQDRGTLSGPWVNPGPLQFIHMMSLELDFPALGAPAKLNVGRQEITIADGRWLGTTPFDPRGRVYDGVMIRQERHSFRLQGGALYIGQSSFDRQSNTALHLQGVGLINLSFTNQHLQFDIYNLLHRDTLQNTLGEAIGYWIDTVGFRSDYNRWGFLGGVGFDLQIPVDETNIAGINAAGIHAEARVRYGPELAVFSFRGTPFLELSSEWTGGIPKFGRTFRAPGPSYHSFLGSLDLVSADNVASSAVEIGLQGQDLFETGTQARVIALADPTGRLYDTFGRILIDEDANRTDGLAFIEVDAFARIMLPYNLYAQTEAGIAFPGAILDREVPVIRFLVTLGFDAEMEAFSIPSVF